METDKNNMGVVNCTSKTSEMRVMQAASEQSKATGIIKYKLV